MARHKLEENEKKPKIGITINSDLDDVLTKHCEILGINRSKYIENLIRKDFEIRGLNITPDFDK
jgi:hypothetical protein